MTESKRKYKEKIVRKYLELYPTDKDIIEFYNISKRAGYKFQTILKELLRQYISEVQNGNRNI